MAFQAVLIEALQKHVMRLIRTAAEEDEEVRKKQSELENVVADVFNLTSVDVEEIKGEAFQNEEKKREEEGEGKHKQIQ